MNKANNHRVIMVHDFNESARRGMQEEHSRYLISLDMFIASIKQSLKAGIPFDSISSFDSTTEDKVEITSDDGGGSSILLAQRLNNLDIRATFFIVTSLIGTEGFLNEGEIRYIRSLGHNIGSHSHTHPSPFCDLTLESIEFEVLKAERS